MKKFLTVILSILMFCSVIAFSLLLSCRSIISKNGINKMFAIGCISGVDMDSYIDDMFSYSDDTLEIRKYVNDEKMKKALGDYVADYIKYLATDGDKQPSVEEIKKIIRDAINEYEKVNNIILDKNEIENALDTIDENIEDVTMENDIKVTLQVIYGNSYLIALGISIAFLLIIFLINKNIKSVCTSLGIVTIINGSMVWLISVFIKKLMESETSLKAFSNLFSAPFKTVAIFSLLIGMALFIIKIFINKYKKEELV